jgi:hypothetical protein
MFLNDKQIWWEASNAIRIPTGILVFLALGLRAYSVYQSSKHTPKRSPRVVRIERIVVIVLWSFIAIAVALILIFKR